MAGDLKDTKPLSDGGNGQSKRCRQLSLVQDLSVPRGKQGQKAAEGQQIADGAHGADVAFEIGLEIRTKPVGRMGRVHIPQNVISQIGRS